MTKIIEGSSKELQAITKIAFANAKQLQWLNSAVVTQKEIRKKLSEVIGQRIDKSVEIRLPFYSDYGRNITLGKNVFINSGVTMTDLGGIIIEDQVLIGPNVTIVSVNHPLKPEKRRGLELAPVRIKRNAWLGANTTVLPGITIGANAVVAAGAVVTKDVPANTVVAGVPARKIKQVD